MSIMTTAPAATGSSDDSFAAGFTDGEFAAIEGLSEARATARANMAELYDRHYAAGYEHGFEYGSVTAAALAGDVR